MADECNVCKSFEGTYWSKFKEVQFLQQLSENPGDGLALPITFVKNVGKKLRASVTLKIPSGSEWVVELVSTGGSLSLKGAGWKEFIRAHDLRKGDTLVFKYNGRSKFYITVFSGKTNCENLCSCFVPKEANRSFIEKERARKVAAVNKNRSVDEEVVLNDRKRLKMLSDEEDSGDHQITSHKSKKICADPRGNILDSDELQRKRRTVTAEEKYPTLGRAKKEIKDDGFVVCMHPSYVHPKYSVVIPGVWARGHQVSNKSQELELRVNGKSWMARFYYKQTSVGLTRGWKEFVVGNGLEEGDVCLFNIVPGSCDPIVFDIRIFRARDDVGERQE